jgi:hypothetical protein
MYALALKDRVAYHGASSGPANLTAVVCWSRMQAEAGQDLRSIIARKELERSAGHGLFSWGVGNAPARAVAACARLTLDIDVVFSIMKSRPRMADVAPSKVVIWRSYLDHDGVDRPLPANSLVTSRAESETRTKTAHYALMCRADSALELGDFGSFDPTAYRNASGLGAPIGASQVTALLRRVSAEGTRTDYRVNLRAKLVESYWVKLGDPLVLSAAKRSLLDRRTSEIGSLRATDWLDLVSELRRGKGHSPSIGTSQLSLL